MLECHCYLEGALQCCGFVWECGSGRVVAYSCILVVEEADAAMVWEQMA